jgi:uncharacterized membrane protein YgdD (TMEM256/DUF423 family)
MAVWGCGAMERLWFGLGAALALLAVVSGAFGAHALEDRLASDDLDLWQTAARYHMYHALALLAVASAAERWGGNLTAAAGWLFLAGVVLFSGSLYLLSLTGARVLGAVTPFGGLCFILGWAALLAQAFKA